MFSDFMYKEITCKENSNWLNVLGRGVLWIIVDNDRRFQYILKRNNLFKFNSQ